METVEAAGGAAHRQSSTESRFPAHRLLWYLPPPVFVFLFFPFRALQWVSLLAIFLVLAACGISYLLYRGTRVRAVHPVTYAYRNDDIPIEIIVGNRATLPAINLGVTIFTPSEIPGQQKLQKLMTLPGGSEERFYSSIRMTHRGEYPISLIQIEGSDPFSIFPWQFLVRGLCRLVIYPSIHHGHIVPKRGVPGGAIRVHNPLYEDVNRVGSIREYMPGDDIRRIHWNASARSGSLMTKQLLPAMDAPAIVIFDMDAEAYPARYRYARIEQGVEVAASLVHVLGSRNQRVGLVSNGLDGGSPPVIPPTGHGESAALALRVLARISAGTDGPDAVSMFLENRFATQAGMGCYIVTPRQPEDLAPQLTHPTMAALRPTFIHLSDRRASFSPALRIDYQRVFEPQELFTHA